MKRCCIYNPYPNQSVTSFYIGIIGQAVSELGYGVHYINDRNEINREDIVLVVSVLDIFKVKKKRPYKILLWCQGIGPEESYMRHKSKMRYLFFSVLEKMALKYSDYLFFVSEAMKEHYQKKYRMSFEKVYVMPCFNSILKESAFQTESKYKKNTFIYAGGMQVWQCVEQMLELYAVIESEDKNAQLLIYTSEKEEASRLIKKYEIENCIIDFCTQDELDKVLSNAKYGFVLREDNAVNRVATPTKFSSYLANGVIPIFSDCIEDFYMETQKLFYKIALPSDMSMQDCAKQILEWEREVKVEPNSICKEYEEIFKTYYSAEYHKMRIKSSLRNLISL